MRVIKKAINTEYGVDANYFVARRMEIDLARGVATLHFEGYATTEAITSGASLMFMPIDVQGILDIPNDPNEDNAYEVCFNFILNKVIESGPLEGGEVIEV